MATESPMRMVESRGARKWPSSKDAAVFGSPLNSMAAEKLGQLMQGHIFNGDQENVVPCRSGSAPPSMEGSFAAIGNLLAQQNFSLSLETLSSAFENCESEEQLRSDPTYFAYYCTNINLNPRLPPPLMSQENRRLVRHIGAFGSNWKPGSIDDNGNKTLHLPMLSTHKEEPEDDRSLGEDSENSAPVYGQNLTTLAGRHKSLVDLIQEDFPRTPSPVYSQSRSSSHAAEEAADLDVHALSPNISSVGISKAAESNSGSSDVCVDTFSLEVAALRLISDNDSAIPSFISSPSRDDKTIQQKDDSGTKDAVLEAHAPARGSHQPGACRVEPKIRNQQEEPQPYARNASLNYSSIQQGVQLQAQGVHTQVVSQGMNQSRNSMEQFPYNNFRFPIEAQPSLHSPGPNHPSYASNTTYLPGGAHFFPNFQPSGLYPPQYGMGGYAMGSVFPPFMPGYPSHGVIPVTYGASGPNFDGRTTTAAAGESTPHLGALLHAAKIYGQQGLMLQPSYVDPLYMQYFPHLFGDAYGASFQQSRLTTSGATGALTNSFPPQDSSFAAYSDNQNFHPPTNGSLSIQGFGKVGTTGSSYYGGPPSTGVINQFPVVPLTSPSLPSSPVGEVNHISRRNDVRIPQGSSRNTGVYSGGQGQRGVNTFDDPKRHYFLEELKCSNARKFELSDIAGHIVEFSVDQHGSRFIQQKLEHCSVDEKVSVFKEVLPHASKLMTDVFGNYVIQKFFEHGSPEQRKELADKLSGQMLQLSLQMYGCRVIQKALEVIEVDQKTQLVQELDGHVMRCVHDQNGNHVIQKCIECVPLKNIEFILSAFRDQVAALATHPYGCRVIQRVLEHCSEELQSQCIVDEILESAYLLAHDQYGNYVTQHVLERGKPNERSQIISKLVGKMLPMSQHKYASNVIEKCLEYGSPAEQELLIDEIIGHSEENGHFLAMMKDQFANYVVQKILEISKDRQREVLLNCVRNNLDALKKYTYGKHIVTRFEQLSGIENEATEAWNC